MVNSVNENDTVYLSDAENIKINGNQSTLKGISD